MLVSYSVQKKSKSYKSFFKGKGLYYLLNYVKMHRRNILQLHFLYISKKNYDKKDFYDKGHIQPLPRAGEGRGGGFSPQFGCAKGLETLLKGIPNSRSLFCYNSVSVSRVASGKWFVYSKTKIFNFIYLSNYTPCILLLYCFVNILYRGPKRG